MILRLVLTGILTMNALPGVCEDTIQRGSLEMPGEINTPDYLYLIMPKGEWEISDQQKELVIGAGHESFIHFSTQEQVGPIVNKYYIGIDYVVLKVETQKIEGRLVFEANRGGSSKYFHLYEGKIPFDAVKAVFFNAEAI